MPRPKSAREQLRYEVERYQSDVLSEKRPAGKLEKLAIERQLNDLKNARRKQLEFSWDHALHACNWFPVLRHPKGEAGGRRFELVPTQKTMLSYLFGWLQAQTELYRFSQMLYSVARGGGKSPIVAGILAKKMCCDLPLALAAENVCCATTRAQATEYVWQQAREFLAAEPSLAKRSRLLSKLIEFRIRSGGATLVSTVKALGADGSVADGGCYHCAVIDELHAFRNNIAHRELVDKVQKGMGKRPNCLLCFTTTAGNDQSLIYREKYDFAEKVLTNVIEADSFFAWIMAADVGDDPYSPTSWQKANPLLGVTVSLKTLEDEAKEARQSPSQLNSFRRYRLNLMVTSKLKAIPPEKWARGNGPLPDLAGRECHGGLDLGMVDDLAAFSLCFPPQNETDPYYATTQAWIPRDCPHDLSSEPWARFIANGSLIVTDSEMTDHIAIRQRIVEDSKRYHIQTLAADPSNSRLMLDELLNDHGIAAFKFNQGHKFYHEPFKGLFAAVAQSRLVHAGDPLLAWSADNVVLEMNSYGHCMPKKSRSLGKIDPFVALLMAFSECLFSENQRSIYETDGLRTV